MGKVEARARFARPFSQGLDTPETIPIEVNYYKDNQWDLVLERDSSDCWGKAGLQTIDNWYNIPTNGEWTENRIHHIDAHRQTKVWYIAASD